MTPIGAPVRAGSPGNSYGLDLPGARPDQYAVTRLTTTCLLEVN